MILPFNYVKSFEDHRKDKSMIHSQKTLKNRLRNLLPNEASIKLFYTQHGQNTHESLLLKLYHFVDIPKAEYQRILSNPLYFLQNERNLRMFRFYLIKNGYSEDRLTGHFERKGFKSRKTSLISNGENTMKYQFFDKTKVNYQQPWKYIDNTIKNMQALSKGTKLSIQNNKSKQRKYSSISQLSKQNRQSPSQMKKDSPKISKSLSTSFIFKIKERQRNTSRIKDNLFVNELQKSNSLRVNFYSKILESELRVKKMKQNHTLERQRVNSEILLKAKNRQVNKLKNEKAEPEMRRHLSELRKICIKSVFKKSESLSKFESNDFVPVTKLKEIRAKQRKEKLKNMLQKRLGIQDVSPEVKIVNPQKQVRKTLQIHVQQK